MNIGAIDVAVQTRGMPPDAAAFRASSSPPEPAREDTALSKEQVQRMIAEMQDQIDRMNVSLQFSTYGERGERVAIVVADKETGEVIREIPSKELQNLYARMSELAGMILDGNA